MEITIPASLSYLEPAFAASAGHGTHVGFVDVTGGTDAVYRTAVWCPADYVQANPRLAVPVQIGENGPQDGPAVFEWSSTANRGGTPAKTATNSQAQVGTVYGTAYDRFTQRIFASAYAKRHTAYGPHGPGAIDVGPLSSNTVSLFVVIPTRAIPCTRCRCATTSTSGPRSGASRSATSS